MKVVEIKSIKEEKVSNELLKLLEKFNLPKRPERESLEIVVETNVVFVNAIRRCEKCPVRIMSCDQKNIETNDLSLIPYHLKSMIEQIPIDQEEKITSLKLYKNNETQHIQPILSSDILVDGKKSEKLFSNMYLHCDLLPFCSVSVDLEVVWGNRSISKIFTYEGNISVVSLELEKMEKKNTAIPSSLEFEPKLFKITVPFQTVITPKKIIINICNHFINIIDKHLTSEPNIIKNENHVIYNFDYVDIGLLVEYYIFELDVSIKKIYSERIDNSLNVFIYHNDVDKLYTKSLENIKRDFTIFRDSLL